MRQEMITENKFSKYQMYAIGEILLVVIGILIALSINNDNDNKRIADYEKGLLKEMTANLQRDLIDLKFSINKNKNILKANKIVLQYLKTHHYIKIQYIFILQIFKVMPSSEKTLLPTKV